MALWACLRPSSPSRACLSTQGELLQAEESALKAGRTQVADGKAEYPVWNHWEFRVTYRSLTQQLCIGGIYVRLLMDGLDKVGSSLRKIRFLGGIKPCE